MNKIKIFTLAILSVCSLAISAKDYKASMFGVKSDGLTLNTRSIQKGVDFISENGGGRLVFYVGRYLTGTVQLKSNVTIKLQEGAVLVGTTSVYDYSGKNKALITADSQQNIGITGKGGIEGQGAALLEKINFQIQKGYLKEASEKGSPALIAMNNCSDITVEQINMMNSCGNTQSYSGCKNLVIKGVTVISKAVAGTKGVLLSDCDGVKISNSYIETSGAELSSAGTSKNVSVVNCKSATGKKLEATR